MSAKKFRTQHSSTPDSLRRGESVPLPKRIADLVQLMRSRIADGKPLNLTDTTHREFTEALHVLAYQDGNNISSNGGKLLKISYGDNLPHPPLRVCCLNYPTPSQIDSDQALHVGTLSFRHLDYDRHVDLYLVRDRETRTKTAGEIDDLAYERMKDVLNDRALQEEGSQVIIYQTGLVPLCVGMYRAIIEQLFERRQKRLPTVAIQTIYYLEEKDERATGIVWA